jgi:VanZ family protein
VIPVSDVLVRSLRYVRVWSTIGWGFVALVVYLSLMRPPGVIAPQVFDLGHLLAYAWLMLWFAQIHRPTGVRLIVGAWLCALGIAIEFAQGLTGYRTFDYADMIMNTLGVGVGLLVARTPLQNALAAVERGMLRRA